MAKVLAIALAFFVSALSAPAFAEAPAKGGPFTALKIFSGKKSAKSLRKQNKRTKYYRAAAKKQRKAQWQRHSLLRPGSSFRR
ncbi:hypothetical protein [Pontibacter actiniarum]|uniref:Uncharacterized protein n=1 Tax=Pontibacter actiniarum TaxID=323450 RepID=A0A1X9YUG5_9BACT|nr:hypothetical protein [Pontibacter actiniarum]ARS36434.1 hypothetical protein CA264_13865 [Pontibacter actiniarum]